MNILELLLLVMFILYYYIILYIFMYVSHARAAWVTCVGTAAIMFALWVGLRTRDHLKFESTVNVEVIYSEESIPFPAVTICNQNNYR